MELKRLVRQENGEFEATWILTPEQMAVLFYYAINALITQGMATAIDVTPEQFEEIKKEAEGKHQLELLEGLDTNTLPKA